jgi:fumarylacetoacetase
MDNSLKNNWLNVPEKHDFSIHNLPFGIFSDSKRSQKRVGVAFGDAVIDLSFLASMQYFDHLAMDEMVFERPFLNDLIAAGKSMHQGIRRTLQTFLTDDNPPRNPDFLARALIPQSEIELHLPIQIGDYTDFYSSESHARNVGAMFRDPANALLPNWKQIPVAYHGRTSSIVVSGTSFHRPKGQVKAGENIVFAPTRELDFELEMAHIIGKATQLGESISIENAEDYVFGFLIFNDLSARDIQRWEYVPLGPFLGKNFCSSVSPWVVTTAALTDFRVDGVGQTSEVLPYLQQNRHRSHFDVQLEAWLETSNGSRTLLTQSNYRHLYWSINQQIAHHTVNGCPLRVGDLMASGTISGDTADSLGSMLELSWGGKKTIPLSNGETRTFLEDGDTIELRAFAEKNGRRVGFGSVRSTVLAARD